MSSYYMNLNEAVNCVSNDGVYMIMDTAGMLYSAKDFGIHVGSKMFQINDGAFKTEHDALRYMNALIKAGFVDAEEDANDYVVVKVKAAYEFVPPQKCVTLEKLS